MAKAFISYATEDRSIASRLYRDLRLAGVEAWIDYQCIRPGENWREAITAAIEASDAFVLLLSSKSVSKRGYVQKEVKIALEILDEFPPSGVFIVPVRCEPCEPQHRRLRDLHRIDLFPSYENGVQQLVQVLSIQGITVARVEDSPLVRSEKEIGVSGSIDNSKSGSASIEEKLLSFVTPTRDKPYSPEEIEAYWPRGFCLTFKKRLLDLLDELLCQYYSDELAERLLEALGAIFVTHEIEVANPPPQMLRMIDDEHCHENTRAMAVSIAGELDYNLGEDRIVSLLSSPQNKVIYAACEYIEYRIGIVDSGKVAEALLALLERPATSSTFTGRERESGREVQADTRYFAARCLALSKLDDNLEACIVKKLREHYPEIEEKAYSVNLNAFLLGITERKKTRLWKRSIDIQDESVFERHPDTTGLDSEEAVMGQIASAGKRWAQDNGLHLIGGVLSNPIPKRGWGWWQGLWQAAWSLSNDQWDDLVFKLFESLPNSEALIDLIIRTRTIPWCTGVQSKKAEEEAVKHMRRLQPWGGRVVPFIKWLKQYPRAKNLTFDSSKGAQALDASCEAAKQTGREGAWYAARRAVYELVDLLCQASPSTMSKGMAYSFADEACWIVAEDLLDHEDPFAPLTELYSMGLVPLGYGLDKPHDDMFYIVAPGDYKKRAKKDRNQKKEVVRLSNSKRRRFATTHTPRDGNFSQ